MPIREGLTIQMTTAAKAGSSAVGYFFPFPKKNIDDDDKYQMMYIVD